MCYRYSFSFALIAVLLLAAGVLGAPSDVVVEKAEDPSVPKPQPDGDLKVPEDCHQPKETGRCFALFYRFAYNVDTQSCEEFVYGGCAGNKNNFETKDLCEQACLGKSAVPDSTTEQISEISTETSTSA
ncbi:kunitz-type serine protease inhibitor bitisilin-2 [Drosophila ficusphila]|uniref:kunitz-type serine protease inhibitor bitisilin-2 n=1 Tax=Drosophila ficusphila TaxID=30025 RepID=UPI0007E86271|nr:kunitz-type serine protease inhibitor bitisilin-2 [Drosophila ficusphila]